MTPTLRTPRQALMTCICCKNTLRYKPIWKWITCPVCQAIQKTPPERKRSCSLYPPLP